MADAPAVDVERAARVLDAGGLVVYPTETLYGLGADATSEAALARLVALKGRDGGKPVSVLVSSLDMLRSIVAEVSRAAERLIERFWPGALTLVLPARPGLSRVLTGGGTTVGARISSHALAQALVARLGRPLTATSANPGGAEPPSTAAAARAYFGAGVDAYLDGGAAPGGAPSTVVDCTGAAPRLVRAGAIAEAAIAATAGIPHLERA